MLRVYYEDIFVLDVPENLSKTQAEKLVLEACSELNLTGKMQLKEEFGSGVPRDKKFGTSQKRSRKGYRRAPIVVFG